MHSTKPKDRFWRLYASGIGLALLGVIVLFGGLFLSKAQEHNTGEVLGVADEEIQEYPFVELPKIYKDSLALGWEDWSWDSRVNFSSFAGSSNPEESQSIEVDFNNPNAGFLISAPHFDVSPYNSIKISVYVPKGSSVDDLFLEFSDDQDKSIGTQLLNWYIDGKVWKPDTWYDVTVPLTNLNASYKKIQSISVVSSKPGKVFLDNIEFSEKSIFFPAWKPSLDLSSIKQKGPPTDLPYVSDFYNRKDEWVASAGQIQLISAKMRLSTGTSTNYASYSLRGGELWSDYRYTVYLDWAVGDSINLIGRFTQDGGFFSCSFFDDGKNVTLNQSQNGKLIELDSPENHTLHRIYNWSITQSLGIEIKGNMISCLVNGEVKVKHLAKPLTPIFGTAALELWSPKNGGSSMMINKVTVEAI